MRGAVGTGLLAGLLLTLAAPACAGLRLEIETAGVSVDEQVATRQLADAALGALPPALRERLDLAVALRWRDDLPEHTHGRARGGHIGLQRALLQEWRQAAANGDDPRATAAFTALLHEIAHIYDRSRAGGLSRDPRLLDLAGWPVRRLRFGARAARNDFRVRSPDAYELDSPAEFVAVNFEDFLLDPAYACRRPALHRYFADHFGWSPGSVDCAAELPLVGASDEGMGVRLLELDPARIYAVDYLFAEANERPMSRWGHSMLRLVVCAPGRPRGDECRLDLQHHLVLSFRAFVDDVQISSWRGLTGSYPSRLFVLPLEQVVDEYTKVELRGLQSIPLRLDDAEIASLVRRAAQVHWSYDGRYYFVSNNCAVETWKLLNDGVPRLATAPLRSITPNGLLRRLQRERIADVSVLADASRAAREGYTFASQAAHFEAMFEIADGELGLPVDDAQDWFALDPQRRRPWARQASLRASAALLLLEQAALRREELQAREALKQRLLRGRDPDAALASEQLRGLLGDAAYAGRPSELIDGGYGLPQAAERVVLAAAVTAADQRLRDGQHALREQAQAWLPASQVRRLADTAGNLDLLGKRLREWHAPALEDGMR